MSALAMKGADWTPLALPDAVFRYCENHSYGVCNWLVPASSEKTLCVCCELNELIPNLDNPHHFRAWQKLEHAKHRLVYSLLQFNLPFYSKTQDMETGLSFKFLSDENSRSDESGIFTGHSQGTITINVAEADSAQRERTRLQLAEPYRTLIGHFRHEIGHYYWERIVKTNSKYLQNFREIFGDERVDYSEALKQHYEDGPPSDWRDHFVSAYSAAHPWEEWAETWAHYFHMIDTLETAYFFRISLTPNLNELQTLNMQANINPYHQSDFDAIVAAYIPLTLAVNSLNRSMGQPDIYPFVLPPNAMQKLRFIHRLLQDFRSIDPADS
jgi:hypothetical protein